MDEALQMGHANFATKLKAFTAIHKQGLNYLENPLDPCNYIDGMYK